MSSQQEIPDTMKNVLRKINECVAKIAEQKNITHSLEKVDFLEKEGFYADKPDYLFNDEKVKELG